MSKTLPSLTRAGGFKRRLDRPKPSRIMTKEECLRLADRTFQKLSAALEHHYYRHFKIPAHRKRPEAAELKRLTKAETADLYFHNPHARLLVADRLTSLIGKRWRGKSLKFTTILDIRWHTNSLDHAYDFEQIKADVRLRLSGVDGIFMIEIAPFRNRYVVLPDGGRARVVACHVHGVTADSLSQYRWNKIAKSFAGGMNGSHPVKRESVYNLGGAVRYFFKPLVESHSFSQYEISEAQPELPEERRTIHRRWVSKLTRKGLFDIWLPLKDHRLTDCIFGVGTGQKLVDELFRRFGDDYVARYAKGDADVIPPWLGGSG